jgi:hypothetical protein
MNRSQMIAVLGGVLSAVVLAYFALIVARPDALARVLLRRGYAERGWDEPRLAARMRLIGIAGCVAALAAILLAIVKFVG